MNIKWISELFSFSRKERSGIVFLLLIIFILILIGKLIPYFTRSNPGNSSKWEAEVAAYLEEAGKETPDKMILHPTPFNPNEVDYPELIKMGVPDKIAANWTKYLEKGGRFSNKEAVKKIFGMTPDLFAQLDRFMIIPHRDTDTESKAGRKSYGVRPDFALKRDTTRRAYPQKEKVVLIALDLNRADSVQLAGLPGIGPVLASRIVRYRNLLGGFYDVVQLKEVYGMREENFVKVSSCLTVDRTAIKTFNINFTTVQQLGRHPYVGFKTARKLFNLRDKKGKFSSSDDLSPVMTSDSLKRFLPYIIFSQ